MALGYVQKQLLGHALRGKEHALLSLLLTYCNADEVQNISEHTGKGKTPEGQSGKAERALAMTDSQGRLVILALRFRWAKINFCLFKSLCFQDSVVATKLTP